MLGFEEKCYYFKTTNVFIILVNKNIVENQGGQVPQLTPLPAPMLFPSKKTNDIGVYIDF